MRCVLWLLVGGLLVAPVAAQEYPNLSYAWTWTGDHSGGDEVSVMVTDLAFGPDGSLHFCGYYATNAVGGYEFMDFDPGPGQDLHSTESDSVDMFCTKVNADGSYGWTWTAGGWKFDEDRARGVAVDHEGNVIITGHFSPYSSNDPANPPYGIDFDPRPSPLDDWRPHYPDEMGYPNAQAIFTTKLGPEYNDLPKENPDSWYKWTNVVNRQTWSDYAVDVAVDAAGDVYICGSWNYFTGDPGSDFDPGPGVDLKTGYGGNDWFVSKYFADGSYHDTLIIGGSEYGDYCRGVAVDCEGNVLYCGTFQRGPIDFDPTDPGQDLRSGFSGSAVTKISADFSTYYWTAVLGYEFSEAPSIGKVRADAECNVYYTGSFSGAVNFDPQISGYDIIAANGSSDAFVSKIGPDHLAGDWYKWTRTFGGGVAATGVPDDRAYDLAVAPDGGVAITGYFVSMEGVDFNQGSSPPDVRAVGEPGTKLFAVKYNADSSYDWALTLGDTPGEHDAAAGYGIDFLPNGDLAYGGGVYGYGTDEGGPIDLNPFPDAEVIYNGTSWEPFATKLETYRLGDLNCDGSINFFDIDPFVLALLSTPPDYLEYYAQYPDCDHMLADCNGDTNVNFFDIDAFVDILLGS